MTGNYYDGRLFGVMEEGDREPTPASTEQINKFRWATVDSLDPMSIRFDGDTIVLPITPASLIHPSRVSVGDRVWCQIVGRRVIVLGNGTPTEIEEADAKSVGTIRSLERTTDINCTTNAFTEIPWQVERFDSDGGASAVVTDGSGYCTAKYDGVYTMVANIQWETDNNTARRVLMIEAAGQRIGYQEVPNDSTSGEILNCSGLARLSAGDAISVKAYHTTSPNLAVYATTQTHFSIVRLS